MSGSQQSIGQGGSASLGYFVGNTSRNVLAPSPATSTTSSQHCIGPYKNGHGPGQPINGKINTGGFAPGHPLAGTNDGRRHYGSKKFSILFLHFLHILYEKIYIYIYIYM